MLVGSVIGPPAGRTISDSDWLKSRIAPACVTMQRPDERRQRLLGDAFRAGTDKCMRRLIHLRILKCVDIEG